MSTIGSKIRALRIEAGLSVDELAARLGKNRATVYRYESDEIDNFPISVIGPLAEELHTSPSYLMGWTDEKKPATIEDDGLSDITKLFTELSPENRSKLIELGRLFLDAQRKSE